MSPDRVRNAISMLATLSRRASWLCALIVGGWVAWIADPLTVQTLVQRTQHLEFSYADVYSELHEQPFAYCDTFYARRAEAMRHITARATELAALQPMAVLTIAREYDATMVAQYEEDCGSAWRPYQNSARFQALFTQDYPLYYAISELKLTEIRLALLQIVAGWLGVVAVALLSVYFWRSPLAPVAGLVVTSLLVNRAFEGLYAVILPGVHLVTMSPHFFFPAVTVLLIIAMVRPAVQQVSGRAAAWTAIGLSLIYGLHALIYYVVDTPVARLFAFVGLAYVCGVGLAYRRWSVVGCAALAAIVQLTLDGLFRRPGMQIYSAVTLSNHLASEAYANVMIYMGLFERPSPFGLFYMDEIFGWVIDQDPILVRLAPFMAVHHSYAKIGGAMVWQAITAQPLTLLDAAFRRILMQTFYEPLWMFWSLRIDWLYTGTLFAIGAVNAWAWVRKPLFLALTPITLCLLVNQFALSTVMTLVHTHSRWNLLGVMLMFAVAPAYLFVAVRLLLSTRSWMPDWRRLAVRDALRGRPYRVAAVALALAAAVWCVRLTITTVRQERRFVGVWMAVHQPPPGGIDIRGIVNTLETMRAETGDARGEIAMWIVSILRMYLGRRPDMPADLRQQVEQWRERYYRQALADAPDNPHYLFAAHFLQIKGWESYLLQGVQRFPDSVYAPGAATALQFSGTDLPAASREWVIRRNETLTGRFLASGQRRIPGFEELPHVEYTSGSVKTERATHPLDRPGLVLTIGPGAVAFLAERPTYESRSIRFVSYMDLRDGDAESGVALGGPGRERRLAASRAITSDSQRLAGRYQLFDAAVADQESLFGLWVKAGPRGATIELRDYYPIVDYPKHYYRSGLMERVRRRAAKFAPRHS